MHISSLVVTAESDANARELSRLWAEGPLAAGCPVARYVPVVLTTETLRAARDVAESLFGIPGVADVQLLSWFDEQTESIGGFEEVG